MKNILQGIGIVFTLVASFLGLMYSFKGDVILSSLLSLIIIVIEYFLIEKFIKSKTEITKNSFSTLSILLWTIYFVLSLPISIFLIHALNVELNAKKEIQNVANQKFSDLNKMVSVFDKTVDQNLTTLSIDLSNLLTRYVAAPNSIIKDELMASPYNLSEREIDGVNAANISNVVRNFLSAKSMKIKAVSDTIKITNNNFINRYGGVFDVWARLQINYAFYELDNLLQKNYNVLSSGFTANMPDSLQKYQYSYSVKETNITKPLELFEQYKPYYLFLAVALFHFLILLPYFIEPVAGRYISSSEDENVGGGIEI